MNNTNPTPWSHQRYRLDRELGRGGMGVVYLGHDLERDIPVALKSQSNAALSQIWLKREFRVVSKLRHPNLVELYDLFTDPGFCFFTMEYIDGVLSNRWVKSGGERVDFDKIAHVLVGLAQALAFLHGRGVVHRDVKPSNVMISGDIVKLLDFGVALPGAANAAGMQSVDRHLIGTVEGVGLLTGTAAFLAPEYVANLELGPSIDVFALGIVGYHLCLGAPPFGNNLAAVLGSYIAGKQPPRVSATNPHVPPVLDDLIYQLTAINPSQRASLTSVIERLSATPVRPAVKAAETANPATTRLPMTVPFVGRKAELQLLIDSVAGSVESQSGAPRMVVISGAGGIGKSAVLDEVALALRLQVPMWRSRCEEHEKVSYRAFDAIVDDVACEVTERLDLQASGLPSQLCKVFPAFASLVNADIAELSEDVVHPQSGQQQAHQAFAQLLTALIGRGRGALLIDDLQWADQDSITLIGSLLSHQDLPCTVIATVTSDSETQWPEHLQRLFAQTAATPMVVQLQPLSPEENIVFVQSLIPGASDNTIRQVAATNYGNPLLAELYATERTMQSMAATAVLQKDNLAHEIYDAAMTRVERMSVEQRAIARCIAAAHGPLGFRTLRDLTGVAPLNLHRCLLELQSARMLRAVGSIDDAISYGFVHGQLRRAAYQTMRPDTRVRLHDQLATWYEQENSGEYIEDIAMQRSYGSDAHRAALACAHAADFAFDRLAYFTARQWYETALVRLAETSALAPDQTLWHRVTLGRARSASAVGAWIAAAAAYHDLAASDAKNRDAWLARAEHAKQQRT